MRYGNVELKVLFDSLSFVFGKNQEIRPYPGTDKADVSDKGRLPTRIACVIKATSIEELILVQQILHSSDKKELHFKHFFFKKVVSGQEGEPKPKSADEKIWLIPAEFVALDPVPYSNETGEVLY